MEQISMAFSSLIQKWFGRIGTHSEAGSPKSWVHSNTRDFIQKLIHSNLKPPCVNSTVQALMSTLATLVPKDWSFSSLYPGPWNRGMRFAHPSWRPLSLKTMIAFLASMWMKWACLTACVSVFALILSLVLLRREWHSFNDFPFVKLIISSCRSELSRSSFSLIPMRERNCGYWTEGSTLLLHLAFHSTSSTKVEGDEEWYIPYWSWGLSQVVNIEALVGLYPNRDQSWDLPASNRH